MSRVFGGCKALMAARRTGARPAVRRTRARPAASAEAGSAEKPKNPAFMSPLPVSPALKNFVGAPEVSRTDAVKKIWEHIKNNQLQNPANKREIRCDEKLKSIFDGRDTFGMLEIGKLLSPHFLKSK